MLIVTLLFEFYENISRIKILLSQYRYSNNTDKNKIQNEMNLDENTLVTHSSFIKISGTLSALRNYELGFLKHLHALSRKNAISPTGDHASE